MTIYLDVRPKDGSWVVAERESELVLAKRMTRKGALEAARIAAQAIVIVLPDATVERVPWRKDGKLATSGRDTYGHDPEQSRG